MAIDGIQSTLQSLQSVANLASGNEAKALAGGGGGFAGELQQSIRRVNNLQAKSEAGVKAFQAGDPDVSLNDVMVDMQKAGLAFTMATQVRNKLVSSYKEIMSMQV